MCSVNLEKAFDRFPRGILWGVLWGLGPSTKGRPVFTIKIRAGAWFTLLAVSQTYSRCMLYSGKADTYGFKLHAHNHKDEILDKSG